MRIPIGTSVMAGALTAALLVACWAGIGSGLDRAVGEDFLRPGAGSAATKDGGAANPGARDSGTAGDRGKPASRDADGPQGLTPREAGTAPDAAAAPLTGDVAGPVGPLAPVRSGDASAVLDETQEAGSILDSPAGVLGG